MATGAQLIIGAREVPCFDFAAPISDRYADVIRRHPGVSTVARVITGFTSVTRQDGVHRTVALIGTGQSAASALPLPRERETRAPIPDAIVVDESSLSNLGFSAVGERIEIGRRAGHVAGVTRTFGTFLGSPYAFATYESARRWLRVPRGQTHYLAVSLERDADTDGIATAIEAQLGELDVWTVADFARRSALYWMIQTGAGGAIALAGFLGFVVGSLIVSQSLYATTSEFIEEYTTLRALGAPVSRVRAIVIAQGAMCGAIGGGAGVALTFPLALLAKDVLVPSIAIPWWLAAAAVAMTVVMCMAGSLAWSGWLPASNQGWCSVRDAVLEARGVSLGYRRGATVVRAVADATATFSAGTVSLITVVRERQDESAGHSWLHGPTRRRRSAAGRTARGNAVGRGAGQAARGAHRLRVSGIPPVSRLVGD